MGKRWSERYLETVNPWNRSTPRSALRVSSAMTHRLFSGSIKLLDLKYDHIFDVDLGDALMRKLPFNNGGNALDAADKFCSREGLSRVNVE